ncbi:mitogen-activated protein kinase kinase kinase [Ranunculus cassubicifolius]
MAPESLNMYEYEPPCDIWALGCVVLQMLTGKCPWYEMNDMEAIKVRIARSEDIPEIPKAKLSNEAQNFLKKCLVRDQNDRWTIDMLLSHCFLFDEDAGRSFEPTPTCYCNEYICKA